MHLSELSLIRWTIFVALLTGTDFIIRDSAADDSPHLLFAYFTGNGEDGLHFAHSRDGYHWQALRQGKSFLTPEAGNDKLMRDPSIVRGPDGKFHLVWTVSWAERGIGHASSTDLIHWSQQQFIPVMQHEPNAKNCWAPELFYDADHQQFLIFWATTIPGRFPDTDNQSSEGPPAPGNNHRMYYVTTKDFRTFSETKLFYDHGFNVIDAAVVRDGKRFAMFLKDESNKPFTPQKNIRVAFSDLAIGPYSGPSEPISGDEWAEGPTAIKIDYKWFVYFDKYRKHRYGLIVSNDLLHWSDETDRLEVPSGMRHGTAFEVPEVIAQPLLDLGNQE